MSIFANVIDIIDEKLSDVDSKIMRINNNLETKQDASQFNIWAAEFKKYVDDLIEN